MLRPHGNGEEEREIWSIRVCFLHELRRAVHTSCIDGMDDRVLVVV